MRKLHADAGVTSIHNGLRRSAESAISHYLAVHPTLGIGQLAEVGRFVEGTVKRHYLEMLTPEEGQWWYKSHDIKIVHEGVVI